MQLTTFRWGKKSYHQNNNFMTNNMTNSNYNHYDNISLAWQVLLNKSLTPIDQLHKWRQI